jgi:hypothetical protein
MVSISLAILASACRDHRPDVVDPTVQAAKTCPPGQSKKGCVVEPPPPPPGDPQLPPVFIEGMVSPLRLDRTPFDWILVTDSRLRMVLRVDPTTLQPVEGFETEGKPLGVASLGMSIFVGNESGRTIDVHDADGGAFVTSFGAGAVNHPADLAVDATQNLVFALDGGRREVRVFDPSGTLLQTISGPGTLPAELENPTAMGLDPVRQDLRIPG